MLGLSDEKSVVLEQGMEFSSFPILDQGVSEDLVAFCDLARDIARGITNKQRMVVHCWAGIGRSGLLASAILVLLGHDSKTVFDPVTRLRGEPIPETEEQRNWFINEVLPVLKKLRIWQYKSSGPPL
jgi:protein tyrosine phosphatase